MDDNVDCLVSDGDVLMVVGPEKEMIQVHSFILRSASKAFHAMLNRQLEALQKQHLKGDIASKPLEIELPDDDADAMNAIFSIIHHRNDRLPDPKETPYFEIAVAADKYDLMVALQYTIQGAMGALVTDEEDVEDMPPEQMWKLAMAASYFGCGPAFRCATRCLVLFHTDSFVQLAEVWSLDDLTSLRVSGLLEEQRGQFGRKAAKEVMRACMLEELSHRTGSNVRENFDRLVWYCLVCSDRICGAGLEGFFDIIEAAHQHMNHLPELGSDKLGWIDRIRQEAGLELSSPRLCHQQE